MNVLHRPVEIAAESGLSNLDISDHANVRFWEKQTFSLRLTKSGRRVTALRRKADNGVVE